MKIAKMRKSLPAPTAPPGSSSEDANPNISASMLAKYTQLPYSESGDIATDPTSSYISVSQDGSTLSVSSANYSPVHTPVSLGTLSTLAGTSLLNAPVSMSSSMPPVDHSLAQNSAEGNMVGVRLLSCPRPLDGEKDTDKLKEHVRILQEENFTRISQIADLQVEVNNLKAQVLELKEDNLKKAIHIAQLERQRRSTQIVVHQEERIESCEASLENHQETIKEEEAVMENSEQTVVIDESQESAMDVIENEEVESAVYQHEVCGTPITVNVETGTTITEPHAASSNTEESLQNAVVTHAIIVSQEVVEE